MHSLWCWVETEAASLFMVAGLIVALGSFFALMTDRARAFWILLAGLLIAAAPAVFRYLLATLAGVVIPPCPP